MIGRSSFHQIKVYLNKSTDDKELMSGVSTKTFRSERHLDLSFSYAKLTVGPICDFNFVSQLQK